jgi:hypothetical protein
VAGLVGAVGGCHYGWLVVVMFGLWLKLLGWVGFQLSVIGRRRKIEYFWEELFVL